MELDFTSHIYPADSILRAVHFVVPPGYPDWKPLKLLDLEESSPWESHPQALAEPYVSLSAHTAPITQVADRKPSRQWANNPVACFAMRPSQALAQDLWRLNRLYFLIAHRT